jgi:maleylacetate reductase
MIQAGVFRYTATDRVRYGSPFDAAVAAEAGERGARRVFVLSSGTLARTTDAIDRLRAALGDRFAGLCDRMGAHTPRGDVVAAANAARDAGTDMIVTLGGGSVTDGGKMIVLCLANDVRDTDALDRYYTRIADDGSSEQPDMTAPQARMISVPTTLSGGEFNLTAGCTDTARRTKQMFRHPLLAPQAVILDPAVTVYTPEWLWLSTGVRAVDHAVEDLCSINLMSYVEGTAIQALKLLARGLPLCRANPADLAARLDCQTGAWLSMVGGQAGVSKGASHGIGHVLGGTANVPHGHTSCIMLPNVLRYNRSVNADRQALVSAAFGRPDDDAADVLREFIAGLGQPGTLRDAGVDRDQLDEIAEKSMHDRWVHTNPRRITGPAQVREILDMAW